MIHEAIIALHPEVVTVNGDHWGKLQAWDANGNDVALNQTAVDAKAAELTAAQATAASDKATSKASAKSKLAALGLSEEEISAAFGI
jgi:conjugal transfer/entry exclusion protein